MRLKICGMKYQQNIDKVASLNPDYLGFIFYDKSPRNITDKEIFAVKKSIKKVGVFVDETLEVILQKIKEFDLQAVQLHGDESPEFCNQLKGRHAELVSASHSIEIIKVFSIKDEFDFNRLQPYEKVCDYYLFDTKGKEKGGNGYTFDWSVLKDYPSTKPYFLSGGIGLDEVDNLLSFLRRQESKYCYALDVNSKFEIEAGLKNVEKLHQFKQELKSVL